MGASGHLHRQQHASDVYFEDAWDEDMNGVGERVRIGSMCEAWGFSFIFTETTITAGAVTHQEWRPDAGNCLNIVGLDQGQQHTARQDVQLIVTQISPPHLAAYQVMGHVVPGWRLPWHHRCSISRVPLADDDEPPSIHYHEHHRRKKGQLHAPPIKQGGKHWEFLRVEYGSQVQNYRRAVGKNNWPNDPEP